MQSLGCALTEPEAAREDITCGIRPEGVEVSAVPHPGWLEAAVDLCEPTGALTTLTLSAAGTTLRCSTTLKWPPAQTRAWFTFKREQMHFFSSAEGTRLH